MAGKRRSNLAFQVYIVRKCGFEVYVVVVIQLLGGLFDYILVVKEKALCLRLVDYGVQRLASALEKRLAISSEVCRG